ncbi:MAG: ATP-binding protein, partial [Ferruginibacter sp.]
LYYIEAFMKYGCFGVMVEKDIKEDEKKILGRFAVEFERTYTRFLDLQKAEAQARESQIEATLERVRSRTMAMQKSEELKEVIQVVYDQFIHLNINVEHTGFILDYKQRDDMHIWLADRNKIQNEITFAYFDSPHWNSFINAKENGLGFFANQLNFQEKNKFYHDLFKIIPELPKEVKDYYFNCDALAISTVLIDNVGLYIENFKGIPYTNEENNTLLRFGKVFQQTYTRFLDLQKAEAQAREAQIEVSLERVRSRSMAMQKSYELPELSSLLFQQVKELGVTAIQNSIGIVNEKTGFVELSTTIHGSHVLHTLNVPMDEQYVMAKAITAWKAKRKSLTLEFEGQELKNYNELRNSFLETKVNFPNDIWIVNFSFFSKGWLSFSTDKNVSDEIIAVIKRFAAVFEQTYTRFLDLQKAEAQAKEAQIEAGLERVRSRTLAMQTSDELADTSIVIFEQLINLGIEPNRLFIGIIKEETHSIEAWATNEDGTKIDNHFTLQTDKNISVNKMYEGWKQKKTSTSIDMKGKELLDYFHYLSDEMQIPFQGGLTQKRRVQTIAYFGQGLIGMASPEEQPAATTQLLERFAAVFNLTYTRFNDLKIVEAHAIQAEKDLVQITNAKQSAEAALVELQATQKQLIQSEKMASLGELTAGIAHEIQNPLNFVNNFSEVSKELLGEMREEMDKGNLEDVKAIMNDIIQNLEKINNHGKRADAIVKGMLQHSQSSTGKKEPIDINALCDEYLRLSYHGLRAKDKTFNASFKTDFDNSIGNINIVAQDIGRVILNLINNAFYAVAEKHKQNIPGYEPTVTVSTRLVIPPSGGQRGVEIKVIDNGNGIPPKVLEKIFQPFFTTKPTGQGTGLGLSLSYDIIKAHGGEVKVETLSAEAAAQAGKEGEGSTFILQLPIT